LHAVRLIHNKATITRNTDIIALLTKSNRKGINKKIKNNAKNLDFILEKNSNILIF